MRNVLLAQIKSNQIRTLSSNLSERMFIRFIYEGEIYKRWRKENKREINKEEQLFLLIRIRDIFLYSIYALL